MLKTLKLSRYVEETINKNVEKFLLLKKLSTVKKPLVFNRELDMYS